MGVRHETNDASCSGGGGRSWERCMVCHTEPQHSEERALADFLPRCVRRLLLSVYSQHACSRGRQRGARASAYISLCLSVWIDRFLRM